MVFQKESFKKKIKINCLSHMWHWTSSHGITHACECDASSHFTGPYLDLKNYFKVRTLGKNYEHESTFFI